MRLHQTDADDETALTTGRCTVIQPVACSDWHRQAAQAPRNRTGLSG
jgi:hypothetical protein